jgi:hypothetical protein
MIHILIYLLAALRVGVLIKIHKNNQNISFCLKLKSYKVNISMRYSK